MKVFAQYLLGFVALAFISGLVSALIGELAFPTTQDSWIPTGPVFALLGLTVSSISYIPCLLFCALFFKTKDQPDWRWGNIYHAIIAAMLLTLVAVMIYASMVHNHRTNSPH